MNSKLKCKCCGEYYESGHDWIITPVGRFYNYDHLQVYVKAQSALKLFRAQNKAKKEKKQLNAKQKREFYANDKPFRIKRAQIAFNAYIRKRDEVLPCISCQRYHKGQYHAGHWKTVGSRGDIRFNEDNCHKQCAPCNDKLSGNIGEYTPRLIAKIGQERVDALGVVKIRKYACEELLNIEKEYKDKLKQLMLN